VRQQAMMIKRRSKRDAVKGISKDSGYRKPDILRGCACAERAQRADDVLTASHSINQPVSKPTSQEIRSGLRRCAQAISKLSARERLTAIGDQGIQDVEVGSHCPKSYLIHAIRVQRQT
jgi:hypothetical protein